MSEPSLPLVLASASPRRRELIGRLGLEVVVVPASIDERPHRGESPPVHVLRVAREKARATAAVHPDQPVLAADTIVVLGDRILGKPRDRSESRAMLALLAGRTHSVLTAVVLSHAGREATHLAVAEVSFAALDDILLDWYVSTGEGDDKAGGYAVQGQGAILVERVEGNVQAVVGLPLSPLPELFRQVGLTLVAFSGARLTLRPATS